MMKLRTVIAAFIAASLLAALVAILFLLFKK